MKEIKVNYYNSKVVKSDEKIIKELCNRKNEIYQRIISGERTARRFLLDKNVKVSDILLFEKGLLFKINKNKDVCIYIFNKEVDYVDSSNESIIYKLNDKLGKIVDLSIFQYEESNFILNLFNKNKRILKENLKTSIREKVENYLSILEYIEK